MSLLRNSSQYILNTIYDCEALTGFLSILFLISERLKFSFRLRISDVDCRGHILPRYRYRTNEASLSTSLLRNSGQYILNTIFITVKHLPVFYRSCFNTVILRLSISVVYCRRHILPSCLVVGKDIQWMKEFFYKIFALNNSVFWR